MTEELRGDPQFGTATLLRPFAGFDLVYQGQAVAVRPIPWTANGEYYDSRASQAGYNRNLVRGLPVPVGARVVLWLPLVHPAVPAPNGPVAYRWRVCWRLNDMRSYRLDRSKPYHIPQQAPGVPDTTPAPIGGPRSLLLAAQQGVIYTQPEPASTGTTWQNAIQHLRGEEIEVPGFTAEDVGQPSWAPLSPRGEDGVIGQGLYDPNVFGLFAHNPRFLGYEVRAAGDELVLLFSRGVGTAPATNWDFTTWDSNLMTLLNTSASFGVRVMVGSAP